MGAAWSYLAWTAAGVVAEVTCRRGHLEGHPGRKHRQRCDPAGQDAGRQPNRKAHRDREEGFEIAHCAGRCVGKATQAGQACLRAPTGGCGTGHQHDDRGREERELADQEGDDDSSLILTEDDVLDGIRDPRPDAHEG